MQVYIAGKISAQNERDSLEQIEALCKDLGFSTFLPHRDVGLANSIKDAPHIFKEDIHKGLDSSSLVVASLEGLKVGAGTAWELGYAYAKGIPCIGIKTDEPLEDAFEYLSSILLASMPIATSMESLREDLMELKRRLAS